MACTEGGQTRVFKAMKQDLQSFTNDFSDQNFICEAQYCRLYHGKIPEGWNGLEGRDVTVKVWVAYVKLDGLYPRIFNHWGLVENFNVEIGFLQSDKATSCCYLPRLIAHCRDDENGEFLGVVYDLQSVNTLGNFVDKAEFKWLERIKVAVGLARLLKYLLRDEPRFLVRDLSATHIMLDKDWNPILFNYFMLDARSKDSVDKDTNIIRCRYGSFGYVDATYFMTGFRREYTDVFAFGVILCELLFKQKVGHKYRLGENIHYIYLDAWELYPLKKSKFSFKEKKYSFVDKSFEEDPDFHALDGPKLSKLARLCVDKKAEIRPNIMKVVRELGKLHVVRDHTEMLTA